LSGAGGGSGYRYLACRAEEKKEIENTLCSNTWATDNT